MSILPEDLTAESLLEWQAVKEAGLERALLGYTERALSAILEQAMSFDLTAASARHLWEEAVTRSLADVGLLDDRLLLEDLLEANIGDDAYEMVNLVLAQTGQSEPLTRDEKWAALVEALDLNPTLLASGAGTFWSDENWIEQTGTGHLPKYIRAIADALMERGYGESRAIATAVNTVKRWARGGPARQGGEGHVSAKTVAKAVAALAEWEAKRVEAKATALLEPEAMSLTAAGLMERLVKPISKWKIKIKRQVRTGFTGLVGRLTLAEMKIRGHQTKTWVTKRDNRVRETHRAADGQTVPIDQPFRVGFEDLQYPGERGKSLHETANCRCVLVPG